MTTQFKVGDRVRRCEPQNPTHDPNGWFAIPVGAWGTIKETMHNHGTQEHLIYFNPAIKTNRYGLQSHWWLAACLLEPWEPSPADLARRTAKTAEFTYIDGVPVITT